VPGSIQSIERAAAVLRLLGAGPGRVKLADVSAALQLPKGTAHGILQTLEQVGFVDQDPKSRQYRLGAALVDLGSAYLDLNELRARSLNWADPLAARTGGTVRVGVLLLGDVLVVHHVFRPDDSAQKADVGALLPAHATALGKVLLAYHPAAAALLPTKLAPYTTRTAIDQRLLTRELRRVRDQEYAVEFGEHLADQASIAAPIHGYGGLVVAAVAVHGHSDRLCDSTGAAQPLMTTHVRECARSITHELETVRAAR